MSNSYLSRLSRGELVCSGCIAFLASIGTRGLECAKVIWFSLAVSIHEESRKFCYLYKVKLSSQCISVIEGGIPIVGD